MVLPKVVVDTNIALVGFLSFNPKREERQLINYMFRKEVVAIGSEETLGEFSRKLEEHPHFKKVAGDLLLSKDHLVGVYRSLVRLVVIDDAIVSQEFCPTDPDDDVFVRVALSAKANALVTNDSDLLGIRAQIKSDYGLTITKPGPLLDVLDRHRGL